MIHPIRKAVHDATGFNLPDEYLTLLDAGRLRFGVDRDDWTTNWQAIVLDSPPALVCAPWHTTVEWCTPEAMISWEAPEYWKPNAFVTFAGNGYGDRWCWDPTRKKADVAPVVLCRHDENETEIYASSFGDFLYRVLLEGFAQISYDDRDELDGDDSTYNRYLSLNVDAIERCISPRQTAALRDILTNDFQDDEDEECYFLISASEKDAIVKRDLLVDDVGTTFQHMADRDG